MNYATITVFGVAHFSARGAIDSDMWGWGLDIDNVEIPLDNHLQGQSEKAANFYSDLKDHLPDDLEGRIIIPNSIPGGCYSLDIPLVDFKNPDATYSILKQYFPKDICE